jgi:DNA repair exonuclease SbcCD ATPase subunit
VSRGEAPRSLTSAARRAVGAVAVAAVFLAPSRVLADDLPSLEGVIQKACAERDRTLAARASLMEEAGVLGDEIARLKKGSEPAVRAGRELETAMKRFDRVAAQLDDVDAKAAQRNRAIEEARRKFEEAATAETERLTAAVDPSQIGRIAQQLGSIEEMRRHVSALVAAAPGFRPVLDVTLSPEDGATEIAGKLQLIEAERGRVTGRIADMAAEDEVLSARVLLKRQLLAELQNAARTAGPDLALIRRETEDTTETLGALAARRDLLAREKQDLGRTLKHLDQRSEEFQARLKSLDLKGDHR